MNFELNKAIELLERTPGVLQNLLFGLSKDWTHQNEGGESWSPFQIVGHLIEGERNDWIPRTELFLSEGTAKQMTPFDRFSQEEWIRNKSIEELLNVFETRRKVNLEKLRSLDISDTQLKNIAIHPEFGEVSLSEHLSTWVAHDHSHLSQISRVLARHYKDDCGPWTAYLSILNK